MTIQDSAALALDKILRVGTEQQIMAVPKPEQFEKAPFFQNVKPIHKVVGTLPLGTYPVGTLPVVAQAAEAIPTRPSYEETGIRPWALEPTWDEYERLFGTTKKQILESWSRPEDVGLPPNYYQMSESEKGEFITQGLPDFLKQHYAGWGDQFESMAGVASRFGEVGIAEELQKVAEGKQSVVGPPESRAQQIWRALPATEAMIALTLLTGGGTGIVSAAGAGVKGFVPLFTRALAPGAIMSAPEAFLEAGHAYNEAIDKGLSDEAAREVHDRVVLNNMLFLTPMNALQVAMGFPGLIGGSRVAPTSIGIGVTTLTEGTQEILQDVISRQALGERVEWDTEMKDNFILGALMGGIFGGAGNAVTMIQEKASGTMPEYLREIYDKTYDEAIAEGVSDERAKMLALSAVSENKSGTQWLEKQIKKIYEEERGGIGRVEETPEEVPAPEAISHLNKGEWLQLNPEGPMYQITEIGKTRVTIVDGKGNKSTITKNTPVYPLEAKPTTEAVTAPVVPEVTPVEVEIGDFIQLKGEIGKGLKAPRGLVVGEGTMGKNIPAWKIEDANGKFTLIPKDDAVAVGKPPTPITPKAEPVTKVTSEETKIRAEVEKGLAKTRKPKAVKVEKAETITVDEIRKLKEAYRNKEKSIDDIKKSLITEIKERLPLSERGWALSAVKNVKTDKQLTGYLNKLEGKVEIYQRKSLKAKITKLVKKPDIKVKKGIKGRITKLAQIKTLLEGNRTTALAKMTANLEKAEREEITFDEANERNELLNMTGLKQMNSTEMANALANIQSVIKDNRMLRQEIREKRKEKLDKVREQFMGILTDGKGLKKGTAKVEAKQLEADKSFMERLVNWQYAWDNLLDKLSKFDTKSKPYESAISKFGAQIHIARGVEELGLEMAHDDMSSNLERIFGEKTRKLNNVLNRMHDDKINLGFFKSLETELILTKGQMIKRYMEFQDETLTKTFDKMGYTDEVKSAINSRLTKEEKEWGDWQIDFYADYYFGINEVFSDMYGVDLIAVASYSPILRAGKETKGKDIMPFDNATGNDYGSVMNRSLMTRRTNTSPLRATDANDILLNHIDHMEHFKAWARPISEIRSVFSNPDIRNAISQYHGGNILNHIDSFINDMARGAVDRRIINKSIDKLRRNFTRAILGMKPAISLKQIPSVFAYTTEMNIADFVSGVAGFWTNPIANYRMLVSKSPYLRSRFKGAMERDIKLAMQGNSSRTLSHTGNALNWVMSLIRMGDRFAVTQGTYAKYMAVLKETGDETQAIQAAEQSTKRTQPTFEIETMAAPQRGGSFWKLATMFQNQPNKYFRIVADNARNFRYGRGSRTKAAGNIFLTWVILPCIFQLIADGFRFDKEHQIRAMGLGPINYFLVLGQLVQNMYGWVTNEPWDYSPSSVFSSVDDLRYAMMKTKKIIEQGLDPTEDIDIEDVIKAVEYYGTAVGKVTGYPTPYAIMVERAIRDNDWRQLIFSRYALGESYKKKKPEKPTSRRGFTGRSKTSTTKKTTGRGEIPSVPLIGGPSGVSGTKRGGVPSVPLIR